MRVVAIGVVFPIVCKTFREGQDIGSVKFELVPSQKLVVEILSCRIGTCAIDLLFKIVFCEFELQVRELDQQDEAFSFDRRFCCRKGNRGLYPAPPLAPDARSLFPQGLDRELPGGNGNHPGGIGPYVITGGMKGGIIFKKSVAVPSVFVTDDGRPVLCHQDMGELVPGEAGDERTSVRLGQDEGTWVGGLCLDAKCTY